MSAGSVAAAAPRSDAILARLLELHPKIIDLTLDRIEQLLVRLDHPERRLAPVIHVAGTNGKGSVTAMLRAGLEGAGQRVQAYTSPHLARFHERIRLAGGLIPEPDLAALLEECEAVNGGVPITFFEITTAAALLAFAREPADHLLLEVGLGGRLDATNVIDRPRLTVITPVALDHQQYLGETLAEIAGEKAGILKRGVPCIVGRQPDQAMQAIRARAEAVGAPLIVAGEDWDVRREAGRLVFQDGDGLLDLDPPRLAGPHQVENAGIAIAALRALGQGDPQAALGNAEWPARMQRLRGPLLDLLPAGAELWLDGGHNPAAAEAIAATLGEIAARAPAPLWLVTGMLDTKEADAFLRGLAPQAAGAVTVTIPDSEAAIPAERLAEIARQSGIAAEPAGSVAEALERIAAAAPAAPLRVLICGSLYLAGAVLRDAG
ncbi:folylpolyglutamate synthase/dihydrofolate synthase family protein [Paralimibaculum aggregatum]|uniref:Dihydrofolate synthase/folylpolyglutamate synthase n=1 Tax=Paralimibaculum aggregatum TaxID=3036245 RepID=A0ABQ6LQ44_9RHOB|nr:folylpolyglutamate synthase/dihydrofolate synthase family protein [Limibaculum sp. NKW23]GMG82919.1 folylpolyglutamate synthase/dihydrofolate synthase family protein [Limibaculum sp. NKW23]